MITAGERLRQLAGSDGAAGALLLAIGQGTTAGAILAGRSGIAAAAAWQHLLAEAQQDDHAANASLPSRSLRRRRGAAPAIDQTPARRRDDILIWGHRWL
ncbi:hypothetical protein MOJ79_18155 [Calidifontimicrobium sp. SYSU G02091]|uniref:hypothetical protein n=1 Tax=Calidifontimicrobium sp. SYSU G02091 TaxID=2926421 RepID=UPI001F53B201|nr:hypothetical protein [Calidifontimicrobium sp. SYSU G02091]MCI1193759.1 hypothetical protein [Calidifontimicrobium sp. SYSU G02091]